MEQAFIEILPSSCEKQQITLGKLIEELRLLPPNLPVANITSAHSHRGYYEDLSFEIGPGSRSALDILKECLMAIGSTHIGYKGGEYKMDENTPVWIAQYGWCGHKIVGVTSEGIIQVKEDD